DKDDLQLLNDDVTTGTEDGLPFIRFSNRVHQVLHQSMSRTVVVKLLGGKIGFQTLSNKIYHLRKPSTPFKIMDLENDYFMYLTVQPWSESFSTSQPYPSNVVAWIRLPVCPAFCTGRPLVSKIKVDGRIQQVEYESLPNICFSYGRFGHLRDSCSFSPRHDQATKQGSHDDPILNNRMSRKPAFGREERTVTDHTGTHFNILHDFRERNQINIGDSNPADSASLKGKRVAFCNNPLIEGEATHKERDVQAIGVRDSALSAGDDIMGCGLEKDKIDGALGLADPNANASFKKDIISSKVVATPSIGLRIQGLSGPFKMSPKSTDFNEIQMMTNLGTVVSSPSPLSGNTGATSPKEVPPFLKIGTYNRGLSLRASSSSLKFKDHKGLRRGSRNFRGKGDKFNVKTLGRESVAEAMTRVVYRINSDGLIADTNNSQGEHLGSSEMTTFFRVVRDYFAEFDVDVTTFLETRVSGMKADGIIAKIGLDCSHRIEARVLRHPKSVRSGSMTTRLVRSSHWLDCRSGFKYRTRFNQFLGLGL
ncbi:hypothetical protein Goshw_022015, partial [Gossypium schwendimanii]|nr:hypothetical protein [Gossypium schwendimanii]